MLLSMTGFGESRRPTDEFTIAVEVRTVNNRYFKISCRSPEGLGSLESDIEKTVREFISRGTVSVSYRLDPKSGSNRYSLDGAALKAYWQRLHELAEQLHAPTPSDLGPLLLLPGAVAERQIATAPQDVWPTVNDALTDAMIQLQEFRRIEGQSMGDELTAQCRQISGQLESVSNAAPSVAADYRDKLAARMADVLAEHDVQVEPKDLLREVSIFADRCDITEEITRLRSHLDQFAAVMGEESSQGRKLEFLGQELFREVNTIGSKANNVEIAHSVVEMKSAVEKLREILQNVE